MTMPRGFTVVVRLVYGDHMSEGDGSALLAVRAEREILNLIHRYCELVDGGRLNEVARLFVDAETFMGGPDLPPTPNHLLAATQRRFMKFHGDTPRTRHVVNNLIIDIDPHGSTAEARSYYTVFQGVDGIRIVLMGRYHDRFDVGPDSRWRFRRRDWYVDFMGDVSEHLLIDVRPTGES